MPLSLELPSEEAAVVPLPADEDELAVPSLDVAGGPPVGIAPPSWHSPSWAAKSEPTRWQHPSVSQA